MLIVTLATLGFAAEPPVSLDRATVPATGRQTATATVRSFGRYSVRAEGPQGTAVELVDRMAGRVSYSGSPGTQNGRADTFLDVGEWRVVAWSSAAGSGSAKLAVLPFVEKNTGVVVLDDVDAIDATLDDLEQRSYRIDVPVRRTVAIEIGGRALADLRLWTDGAWLHEATPSCRTAEPIMGQPIGLCTMVVDLMPGTYQLTAYGGPVRAWAETSDARDLHLRVGIPHADANERAPHTISALGIDRYIIDGSADTALLELPTAEQASLAWTIYSDASPFAEGGGTAAMTRESRVPAVFVQGREGTHSVVVRGTPGQSYILETFDSSADALPAAQPTFLRLATPGPVGDHIDLTALIVPVGGPEVGQVPLASSAIPVSASQAYVRRTNLPQDTTTLFVDVRETGRYRLSTGDLPVNARIEPFFVTRPPNYQVPDFQTLPAENDLTAGLYVITLVPNQPGVATIAFGTPAKLAASPTETAYQGDLQIPALTIPSGRNYALRINSRPGAFTSYEVRKLPIELTEPLSIGLAPGASLQMPILVGARGAIKAQGDDGSALDVSVDGAPPTDVAVAGPGTHVLTVRNPGTSPVRASVGIGALAIGPIAPKRPLALPGRIESLPVITADDPQFTDLDATGTSTWRLRVDEPGLYTVETTGLLATQGAMRTRVHTSLFREQENGVGRNMAIEAYLREGDYLVTSGPVGQSAGHMGVRLRNVPMRDGGQLREGIPARAVLDPHQEIVYTFKVPSTGDYSIQAIGPRGVANIRLEDADGWPLETPGIAGDLRETLTEGTYRIVLLPDPEGLRSTLTVTREDPPEARAGHGPFALAIDETAAFVWYEPQEGAERVPDTWTFTLPAQTYTTVNVDGGMAGEVTRDGQPIGRITPGRAFEATLPAGTYKVALTSGRRDNAVRYSVGVTTSELVAGVSREVSAPSTVQIAVGSDGVLEIGSSGTADVRGRLFDSHQRMVAGGDDRPDDWNFSIDGRFTPGVYTLQIDPVGASYASTTVSVRAPKTIDGGSLPIGTPSTFAGDDDVRTWTVAVPDDGLLVARAQSSDVAGISVETADGRTLGTDAGRDAVVAIRLGGDLREVRVRAWSMDRRNNSVSVSANVLDPAGVADRGSSSGAMARGAAGVASIRVKGDRPGTWTVSGSAPVLECVAPGLACTPVEVGTVAADAGPWLIAKAADGAKVNFVAQRVEVGADPVRIGLVRPTVVDLSQKGPVAVIVTATAGRPGVRIAGRPDERIPADAGMAPGSFGVAAIAVDGGAHSAVAFPADGSTGEASVRTVPLKASSPRIVTWGRTELALSAGELATLTLPGGRATVQLPQGVVLANADGARLSGGIYAEDGPVAIETTATSIVLACLTDGSAPVAIDAVKADTGPVVLAKGSRYDAYVPTRAIRSIAVPGGSGTLHVVGAEGKLVRPDGSIGAGSEIAVGAGGRLLLDGGPGLIVAWVDEADAPTLATRGTTKVEVDSTIGLSGDSMALDVTPPGPGVLSLRTTAPAELGIVRGGHLSVSATPGVLDAAVTGPATLDLRGVGGMPLWGEATVSFRAATPLTEGIGKDALVGPGESVAYGFTLSGDRTIGLGIRADSDVLQVEVLDSQGERVGEGVVVYRDLPAGAYVVVVRVPADHTPVTIRPAIYGTVLRGDGPPPEVVRAYVRGEPVPNAPEY